MARRFPQEVHDFIRDHVTEMSVRDLAAFVTEVTGYEFTEGQMKSYLKNHKLHNGRPKGLPKGSSPLFPAEVQQYIRDNNKGVSAKTLAEQINERFGTDYATHQIQIYRKNNHLVSGLTGRFEKGHEPPNKGRKGYHSPGCEKGWYKSGNLPHNTKPIGWERIRKDGYTEVKIRERPTRKDCNDNFIMKHRLLWEQAHGPLGPDDMVIFKDGNKRNFDLDNLMVVTKAERLEMSRNGLFFDDPQLTESGALVAKLIRKMYDTKGKRKNAE